MAGNIKGITIEFDGNTTKLDKALKQINDKTRKLDSELKTINRDLKFNPSNVTLWQQKQDVLTKKVEATRDKLKALKEAQAKLTPEQIEENQEEYRQLQREIVETESKLKNFEGQLRAIGNVKLKALGEQFKQVGNKMTAVGKELSMKVTAPLVAMGAVAVKKFADVDKIMQLTNATMGNSTEQAELLNKAMKEAAANSTYGMNDAAQATLNFARAGLTAEEAAAALAPAMALAAGEGGNLDTVSGGLVATINGFHGSFEDASYYADVFANACNNSALDVDSLSNAMSVAAPVFSAAGYTVKDAALYMGVMANNGIEADKAANSLKTGMSRLISPSKDAQGWMDRLNISITNADGTMKDSVQVQAELHDAFSTLSEAEQIAAASAIFGKNQMSPWLALINTGTADVDKLSVALDENGTAIEMQSQMMEGFGGSLEKLKSGLDVLATSMGEALAPIISKVADGIQRLVDWFNALSPQAQRVIAVIVTIVAAIGPLLVIMGVMASSIGSIISLVGVIAPMLAGLLPAIAGVSAGMMAALGVIGLIVGAGILLYKNWDTIKAKASALKESILSAWENLKARTKEKFDAIKSAIITPIENAKTKVKEIIDKIKGFFTGLKLKLPHINLPHFSVSPAGWKIGDLLKGTIPKLSIKWYRKGEIFGGAYGSRMIGVGEYGPEALIPLYGKEMQPFAHAIAVDMANEMAGYMATLTNLNNQGGGSYTIHNVIELGGTKVAEQVFKLAEQGRVVMQG